MEKNPSSKAEVPAKNQALANKTTKSKYSDSHKADAGAAAVRTKRAIVLLCVCILAVIVGILSYLAVEQKKLADAREAERLAAQLAYEQAQREQLAKDQAEFEALANSNVFAEGVSVDGIDIGGMTIEQARNALMPAVEAIHNAGNLQLSYGGNLYTLNISNVIASNDLDSVLAAAFKIGKTGDLVSMREELEDAKTNGKAFSLTANYDLMRLKQSVANVAEQIDREMQNPGILGISEEDNSIQFSEGVTGVKVQQDQLVEKLMQALSSTQLTPVEIPVIETPPSMTGEEMRSLYQLRGSATTNFRSSNSNRKYNIRKGAGMVNGTVVRPGEVFSMNGTLGTRTQKNGWKLAGAYENGRVEEQAGGGVCQLSTTLYNAVVKSDLQIVSRQNHSMKVSYIDMGLDATINSVGNIIDFKFRNNTLGDIIIIGYTTNNATVTFEIWGLPFATDEYDEIKLTSARISKQEPTSGPKYVEKEAGEEKPDGSGVMQPGETWTYIAPRTGYVYQSTKHYYKNGTEVRSEYLDTSTYKTINGEIWVCTTPGSGTPSGGSSDQLHGSDPS